MKSPASTFDLYETTAKVQKPISQFDLAWQMKMPVPICFKPVRTFETCTVTIKINDEHFGGVLAAPRYRTKDEMASSAD